MKKGVSLISLVVTIIVLIILAGIVIISIQNNNPIDKAKESVSETDREACKDELRISVANKLKDNPLLQKNSINASAFEDMKKYIPSLTKEIAEKYEIVNGELVERGKHVTPVAPEKPELPEKAENDQVDPDNPNIENDKPLTPEDLAYLMGTPNRPELIPGMIPIKYNGTNWVICSKTDVDWYNYAGKKWANVMLSDGTYKESLRNYTTDGKTIVEEKDLGSMFVWIPRFAYSINNYKKFDDFLEETDSNEEEGNGQIITDKDIVRIKFLQGISDEDSFGQKYPEKASFANLKKGEPTPMIVHRAFNYDDDFLLWTREKQIRGFWSAKFEASTIEKETDEQYKNVTDPFQLSLFFSNPNNKTLKSLPNKYHWCQITIGNAFKACYDMRNKKVYGIKSNADTHLMRNLEWAAIAYLSTSPCGKVPKIRRKISFAQGFSHLTGGGSYLKDIEYSTTNNPTGIYDLNGGLEEYVAAYWNTKKLQIKQQGKMINLKNMEVDNIFNNEHKIKLEYKKYFEDYSIVKKKNKDDTWDNVLTLWDNAYSKVYNSKNRVNDNQSIIDATNTVMQGLDEVNGIAITEINEKPAYTLRNINGDFAYFENANADNFKVGTSYNLDKFIYNDLKSPFIMRGGNSGDGGQAGVFAFAMANGQINAERGFRPTIYP